MMDQAQLLKNLESAIEEFGLTSLKSRFKIAKDLMSHPVLVDVAVFGRFKAGKSSFINDLIGQEVLPIGVIPVTAVITRLRYGTQERIGVRRFDGKEQVVSLKELSQYISETENPENVKQVESVDIELPSLKQFEGLQFVDTPGLGSVFKHNTETSLNWLPNVGVALVAVSVDPPLSEQDISFIRELQRFTPKIMVLLSKCDLVSSDQLGEIEAFIKIQLQKNIGSDFQIWPFSNRPDFSRFKNSLEAKLLSPLAQKKDTEIQNIAAYKLEKIRTEAIGLLSVALKASQTTDADRERLQQNILGEKAQLSALRDEFQMLVREYNGRTRPFIMAELNKNLSELENILTEEFDKEFKTWEGRLWALSRKFEDWLRISFRRELSAISINQTGTFLKPLNDAHAGILRAVRAFQSRLAGNIKENLGVNLEMAEFDLDIKIPAEPDISFSRIFDSHIDILSFAIPMTLFRGAFGKHFRRSIRPEVEKNLSRLASQWTEGINKSILRMGEDAQGFVVAQMDQITQLLQSSLSRSSVIESLLNQLSDR